jgi:hypothetical protein
MHSTLQESVLGFIDTKIIEDDNIHITGWCMLKNNFNVPKPIRVKTANTIIMEYENKGLKLIKRNDVCRFYNIETENDMYGWECKLPISCFPCELQMEISTELWVPVFDFTKFITSINSVEFNSFSPSYIVIDNFYKNPDYVREFALSCNFEYHNTHKGKRTEQCYRFDGLKEKFEQLIGKKILSCDKYGTNGCFQYCINGDNLVYHIDLQQYAGVLFLTPDAPVKGGTCLLRSIHTKKMKVTHEDHNIVFQNGYLDASQFEVVDVIGNIYNRLVLFDSQHIHAAMEYFGDTKETGRLFQLFFFDLE